MRYHHTKNKGDLGAIQVMADLTRKGYSILVPLTEHEAFDFVAYSNGRFIRVQAKYRAAVRGTVTLPLRTCWADRHGVHLVPIDREAIDVIAIFCPDTIECYYVDPQAIDGKQLTLWLEPTGNSVAKGVRWAKDFRDLPKRLSDVSESPLVGDGQVRQSLPSA